MRNYLGQILIFVGLAFVLWLGLGLDTAKRDESELRLRTLCDSLQHANREHELHIMQLEKEIEDVSDALSDCQEDFQDCLAGRVRYRSGDVRPAINPKY